MLECEAVENEVPWDDAELEEQRVVEAMRAFIKGIGGSVIMSIGDGCDFARWPRHMDDVIARGAAHAASLGLDVEADGPSGWIAVHHVSSIDPDHHPKTVYDASIVDVAGTEFCQIVVNRYL